MSAPSRYEVLRKATRLLFKIQMARFETARAVLNALAQRAQSQRTRVVELAGYPAVFLDRQSQDIKVEPTPLGRLLGVPWGAVFAEIEPTFSYDPGVFQSIVDAIRAIVATPIGEEADLGFYHEAVFGDRPAVYYLEYNQVIVEYYDEQTGTVRVPVLVLDGHGGCSVRTRILSYLDLLTGTYLISCDGEFRQEVAYDPVACPHVDQLVTYLRQLTERQWYCVNWPSASNIMFKTGPLKNAVINKDVNVVGAFGDSITYLDLDDLYNRVAVARAQCAQIMANRICPPPTAEEEK